MTERSYPSNVDTLVKYSQWGAIWAGMFTFVAIWSIFGVLGEAIFASAANPTVAHPVTGMSVGMGIWAVILTIIAMFVAGRVTGSLSGAIGRAEAIMSGIAMFGLSVAAVLVISVFGGVGLGAAPLTAGTAHSAYLLSILPGVGWFGFAALLLGWLAAMSGASSAIRPAGVAGTGTGEIRRAA